MKTTYECFMERAEGSANLARKYRLAIIDGTQVKWMGFNQTPDEMASIVKINDEMAYAYYAAARAIREGV